MRPVPPMPPPPLPAKRLRQTLGGGDCASFTVALEVVTPIMGGAVRTRDIDDVDTIRTATVRGHLRFWWRALYGHQFADAKALYEAEGKLWGRAAEADGLGRSAVEVRVAVQKPGDVNADNPTFKDPAFYAIWPTQAPRDNPYDIGKRREPGTAFDLTVVCPAAAESQVKDAVRAWILFGGYGGRTRRGLGTLKVTKDAADWLPSSSSRESLQALFGPEAFAAISKPLSDMPRLAGAGLAAGSRTTNANAAWITALNWLRDFRQKRGEAREQGSSRPGRTKWPEADKVRHLSGRGPWAHVPRANADPAWPRAGFGLPIITQFQKKDDKGNFYQNSEPRNYEIRWRSRGGGTPHDRLASPLIVKAMALADGGFAPIALWLARAHPDGEVIVVQGGAVLPGSAAPFDKIAGKDEAPLLPALAAAKGAPDGTQLQQAFFGWLAKNGAKEVL